MKIKSVLALALVALFFSSCQNKPEELKYLPETANFVLTFLPKQLQQESGVDNFSQTKAYQNILKKLDAKQKELFLNYNYIFDNTEESGIDLNKNIFFFGSSNSNGYHQSTGFVVFIKSPDKFKLLMENLISSASDSMEIIEKNGMHYLISTKVNPRKILVWNNTVALANFRIKGRSSTPILMTAINKMMQQKINNSLASNKDFLDFYSHRQDFSFWYSSAMLMDKLPLKYRAVAQMQMPISLKGIYFHQYLRFDKGEIVLQSALVLPDELKDFLKKYKIVKPHFDKKMLGFIPNRSIFNVSFAINPSELLRMIRDLYAERQIDTKGMEQLFEVASNIKLDRVFKALSGDCVFNINNVEFVDTHYNGTQGKDSLHCHANKKLKWLFSTVIKLDDEQVYLWLLDQIDNNKIKMPDGYFVLGNNPNNRLFASLKEHYVMITNQKDLIENFVGNTPLSNSLLHSEIAEHLTNYAIYAQLDMDYSTYPNNMQLYFDSIYSHGRGLLFKNKLSQIRFEPKDSYTNDIIVDFKDDSVNSLRQIME